MTSYAVYLLLGLSGLAVLVFVGAMVVVTLILAALGSMVSRRLR